ncbi:MAG: hypothetical protein KDJ67_14555 [Nitratireductor sp.]|nr:hypothetical protein [Nitratireductor sp.]
MSDWGRGSSRASASGGSSLLVVLLALIAIGASGYIAWDKLLSGNSGISLQASLDAKDVELANLRRQLELAEKLATENGSGDAALIASLRRELSQDKELIAELRAQLDNGNGDQIPRLESELADRDKALAQNEKTIAELRSRIEVGQQVATDLERQLEQATKTDIPALNAKIVARDEQLKKMDAEITRLSSLEDEIRSLKANAGSGSADQNAAKVRISGLEAKVAGLEAQLDAARKSREALEATMASRSSSDADNRNRLTSELAEARAETEKLRREIESLQAVAETAKAPKDGEARTAAVPSDLSPRDPLKVAEAIENAKGLDGMSNGQRDRIATGLIEGQCVAKVLADTFGRAPAVALRDLIRALESDC